MRSAFAYNFAKICPFSCEISVCFKKSQENVKREIPNPVFVFILYIQCTCDTSGQTFFPFYFFVCRIIRKFADTVKHYINEINT